MAETSRIFMQLTGPSSGEIKGESVFAERPGWIELHNWNWALNRAEADDAIPEPSLLSFEKRMDRASTTMLGAMIKGEQLRATIIVDDSASNLLELTIRLEQVTIRKYDFSTDISDVGGTVDEDWTFDYRWITFEYQQNAKSGVKSIKLHRPLNAEATTAGKTADKKEGELSTVVSSMLAEGMDRKDLDRLWERVVKKAERDAGREKSLKHASTVPDEE